MQGISECNTPAGAGSPAHPRSPSKAAAHAHDAPPFGGASHGLDAPDMQFAMSLPAGGGPMRRPPAAAAGNESAHEHADSPSPPSSPFDEREYQESLPPDVAGRAAAIMAGGGAAAGAAGGSAPGAEAAAEGAGVEVPRRRALRSMRSEEDARRQDAGGEAPDLARAVSGQLRSVRSNPEEVAAGRAQAPPSSSAQATEAGRQSVISLLSQRSASSLQAGAVPGSLAMAHSRTSSLDLGMMAPREMQVRPCFQPCM